MYAYQGYMFCLVDIYDKKQTTIPSLQSLNIIWNVLCLSVSMSDCTDVYILCDFLSCWFVFLKNAHYKGDNSGYLEMGCKY